MNKIVIIILPSVRAKNKDDTTNQTAFRLHATPVECWFSFTGKRKTKPDQRFVFINPGCVSMMFRGP